MNMSDEGDSFPVKLSRYIESVRRDQPNRAAEMVAILIASFGVWIVGAFTLLTWPLRHMQ